MLGGVGSFGTMDRPVMWCEMLNIHGTAGGEVISIHEAGHTVRYRTDPGCSRDASFDFLPHSECGH